MSAAEYEEKWVYQRSQDKTDDHRFFGTGIVEFDEDIEVTGFFKMNSNTIKFKKLAINTWNMNTTDTRIVAHGIASGKTKILMAYATIHSDAGTVFNLDYLAANGIGGGAVESFDDTNINLSRVIGGNFDNGSYEDPVNRGYVLIWYQE